MKRLAIKYTHFAVVFNSKGDEASFRQEQKILNEVSHQNIRRLHKSIIRRIPFVERKGHFYLENVQFSLLESKSATFPHQVPLNPLQISQQIIETLDYLHTRAQPITHGNLNAESIFIVLDPIEKQWLIKIGDFSHAEIHYPPNSTNDIIPLHNLNGSDLSIFQKDLQAVASVIFFILTKTRENHTNLQQIGDTVEEVVEKFVGVLLHKIVEEFVLLLEASDELLRGDRTDFFLLRDDVVKQVRQTC